MVLGGLSAGGTLGFTGPSRLPATTAPGVSPGPVDSAQVALPAGPEPVTMLPSPSDPAIDGVVNALCGTSSCDLPGLRTSNPNDVIVLFLTAWTSAASIPGIDPAGVGLTWHPRSTSVNPAVFYTATEDTPPVPFSYYVGYEWYAVASSPLTDVAISVTFNPASSMMSGGSAVAFGVSGADTSNPFDPGVPGGSIPSVNSGAFETSASLAGAGTITTADDGDLVLGLVGLGNFSNVVPEASPVAFSLIAPVGSGSPSITLSPAVAFTGTTVTVTGTGFSASDTYVSITAPGFPATPPADICGVMFGTIDPGCTMTVPSGQSSPLLVTATGYSALPPTGPGNDQASADLIAVGFPNTASAGESYLQPYAGPVVVNASWTAGPGGPDFPLIWGLIADAIVPPAAPPSMAITPYQGPVNTELSVTATGLQSDTVYTVEFGGAGVGFCETDASGALSGAVGDAPCQFDVPSFPAGGYEVSVGSLSASFTLTTPDVTVSPGFGPVGTLVVVTATGLASGTVYDLWFDGVKVVTTYPTDGNGDLTSDITPFFNVPSASPGTYPIDFYEDVSGNFIASASTQTFTVTTAEATITPTSGPSNTQVTVTATGLAPAVQYDFMFDTVQGDLTIGVADCTTDPTGDLTGAGGDAACQFDVLSIGGGTYYVDLSEDNYYIISASSQFTLTSPYVTVSSTSGAPGPVSFTAYYLSSNTPYDVYLDTTEGVESSAAYNPLGVCTTNGFGTLDDCTVTIPTGLTPGTTYYVDLFQDPPPLPFILSVFSFTVPSTPPGFPVTFLESGLPAGTTWYANISGGPSLSGTANMLTTTLPNGTYDYTIGSSNASYEAAPGSFTVDGSSVSEPVAFRLVTYAVTFTESGIPAKMLVKDGWAVVLDGTRSWSMHPTITFTGIANGTYPTLITGPAGYSLYENAILTPNEVVVHGPTSSPIPFVKGKTLTLTFSEKGLANGQSWCVSLNDASSCTTKTSQKFVNLSASGGYPSDVYNYAVVSPLGGQKVTAEIGKTAEPTSGSLYLERSTTIAYTFAYEYAVTFAETGLTSGTWSVTIKGHTETEAWDQTIQFNLPNGTYTYKISPVSGYKSVGVPPKVTVNGAATSATVTFTRKI